MKTKIITSALLVLVCGYGQAQFSFGVSPGLHFNSAYFGVKLKDKVVPYVSFQYFGGSMNASQTGEEFDYSLNQVTTFNNTYEYKFNAFVPSVGLKWFMLSKAKLKLFANANFSKPVLTGKVVNQGQEDPDFRDAIKGLNVFGGEAGLGAEYYFDEQFSLGGEFGLRMLHVGVKESYDSYFFNPLTGLDQATTIEYKANFNLRPTYSKISLNFYF